MKKNLFRLFSLLAVSLVGTTAIIALANNGFKFVANDGTPDPGYSIVLDETNAPMIEETYDRELGPEMVFESGDYNLNLKYRLAKAEAGYHVTLAPHGFMYNEVDGSTYKNRITSFLSISATYSSSSSISIRTSLTDDGKEFGAPQTLASGGTLTFTDNPYYFILEAGDAAAKIESLVLNYSCEVKNAVELSTLSGTYTGVGNDGFTYKLALNGANATIESLDKASNVSFSGTAEIVNSNQIKCTLDVAGNPGYYTADVSADQSKLEFASKTGAAAIFPEIDFAKVYKVEDFQNISALGNGYGGSGQSADQSKLYEMTGLKSQWHSDWYTNGSTYGPSYINDIKSDGYGWRLMGSTDYLQFTSTKGHNGTKAGVFKGNTNALRNIQFKSVLGLPNIIGRGAYLSFWAKAYKDSALTQATTADAAIKALVFYTQQVTKTTQSNATELAVTIPAGSDWARYTVLLDSTKTYYSFGFNTKQTSGTAYIIVDDVEIYTANPYAEYTAPVAVTGVEVTPSSLELEAGKNGQLTATVSPSDATNKNVEWTTSDNTVATVGADGSVHAVAAGTATITATTVDGGFDDTCLVTVTGTASYYPEGTFMAVISTYKLVIAIGNATNGEVAVRVSTADATATGIVYDNSTNTFNITTTGEVGGYTVGNITGTYDFVNDQLINVNCSGQIGAVISNVTLTRPTSGMYYPFEGDTATLQSQLKRRYREGSNWNVDSSNADRITSNTTTVLSGESSMTVRPCGNGYVAYGFVLMNDFASPKTAANVHFWVYNPCDYDITFRIYYFKSAGLTNNGQVGLGSADKAKAHSWTYVSRGFTESAIYNFNISVWTEDQTQSATTMSAKLVFDDLLFY